jgi:DNA (cytosine-5)-methyltransferase 1
MRVPYSVSDAVSAPPNGGTFVSAYSGCGGLDLGFRIAGFAPVWANDVDRSAIDTYTALLGEHAVVGKIEAVALPKRGEADLVIGGPPCQGFSVAGRMDPNDPRSAHVTRFLDLVERVRPEAFVMENVKALAVSPRWADVRESLVDRARRLGFTARILVLNAADFGVPQRRERMFLVGLRGMDFPDRLEATTPTYVTVGDALRALLPFGEPGNDTRCSAGITPARRPVLRPTAYRGSLLFNGNGRPLDLEKTAPTLPASMGGNATPIVDQRQLVEGGESWVVGYHHRLLSGRDPLKRVSRDLRRITVEEAAQLQGFPIGMDWRGRTGPRYRQVGNAVPPPLAYAVASALAELLGLAITTKVSIPLAA